MADQMNIDSEKSELAARAETQAERAYRVLEDEIVRLALAPGMRLTEHELVTGVGLGRTPVREAVQRLVADGLLVVYPRKGMSVAAINPLEVLQALEVRAVLERLMAHAAARKANQSQRTELHEAARGMLAVAQSGDASFYMRLDRAFDLLIGEASGNPFAARALAPLQTMSRRAWFYFRSEQDLVATAALHARVAQCVMEQDAAGAADASDALIAHVRSGLKQAIAAL